MVKKGVSWALRLIGKRDLALNRACVTVARRLAGADTTAARWVKQDARRAGIRGRSRAAGATIDDNPIQPRTYCCECWTFTPVISLPSVCLVRPRGARRQLPLASRHGDHGARRLAARGNSIEALRYGLIGGFAFRTVATLPGRLSHSSRLGEAGRPGCITAVSHLHTHFRGGERDGGGRRCEPRRPSRRSGLRVLGHRGPRRAGEPGVLDRLDPRGRRGFEQASE